MKSCSSFSDLAQFGIKSLTGEADALGYRILCDLDLQGVEVFKECFGIPCISMEYAGRQILPQYGLAENWNSGSIASVMLTEHEIIPLGIMGFYLQGYTVVVTDEVVYALEADDKFGLSEDCTHYELNGHCWPSCYGVVRRIIKQKTSDGRVVQGTRNIHQLSGRAQ